MRGTAWAWFLAWIAVGAGLATGVISMAIGPLVGLPSLLVGLLLWHGRRSRDSVFGLLSGAGLACLFIAYSNRHGPGTHCWTSETARGCAHGLPDPAPWFVIGLALLVAGVAAQLSRAPSRLR